MAPVSDVHPSVLVVAEQDKPPLRGLEVEIFDQRASYLHIRHNDALAGRAALEAVLEGQVSLDVGPQGTNNRILEEPADQLPIVVRKDVPEDEQALHSQGGVEFLTRGPLELVLLL